MTNNEGSKTVTLLISIYDWNNKEDYDKRNGTFINPVKEDIFKVQIKGIKDMIILTHRLGVKVRYKKPTDKNWYSSRAMIKRLFRKEIDENLTYLEPVISSLIELKKTKEEYQQLKSIREVVPMPSMPSFGTRYTPEEMEEKLNVFKNSVPIVNTGFGFDC
ncbi:hypothetical protein [Psychrobacillus psychrotolerans]|uniref:hypothetical protein n=1 Tax=Psychrobacillus psychrotolerans TaxID=126156 RepID=UPI0033155D3B